MACTEVGSSNPDIAGFGIIFSFAIQAGSSFVLSVCSILIETRLRLRELRRFRTVAYKEDTNRGRAGTNAKVLRLLKSQYVNHESDLIDRVLMTIGNTQLLNRITLLVSALYQHETLGLYHLHIVYDLVNFTGVSAAAAVATGFKKHNGRVLKSPFISLYLVLYLAFAVLLGLELRMWDESIPGQCYHTDRISTPSAFYPDVDIIIYLVIMGLGLFESLCIRPVAAVLHLFTAIQKLMGSHLSLPPQMTTMFKIMESTAYYLLPYGLRITVLALTMIQYPIHGYMVYALRASNEKYLSGSSENEWGFGQIVALVLLISALIECIKAFVAEYRCGRYRTFGNPELE